MDRRRLMLFAGSSNPQLAKAIADFLKIDLSPANITEFSDGETRVKIEDDVRGEDVFILQSTGIPTNNNYMELFITIDALRRASAGRITAVIPYFGYARQDRKDQPRVPISAKLIANLLTASGVDRVLTLDLHAHQIQGFFDIPLDHIYGVNVFIDYFKDKIDDPVIVSPDAGGAKMASGYARRLNCDMAIIDKRRIDDKNTEALHVLGEVEGKDAIIVDDIVATGGSLVKAAEAIKKQGAKRVFAAITHGVLSGPALERIAESELEELCITDSIPQPKEKTHPKIKILSVDKLLGEAVRRIHAAESVSSLFREN